MRRLLLLIAAASVLPGWHCAAYEPYYSDFAYYDPRFYAYDSVYVYGAFDPLEAQPVDVGRAAAALAARATEAFSPGDCVTAVAAGATVLYQLHECKGRFGGKLVDGRVTATLSLEGEQLRLAVISSELTAGEDEIVIDLTAAATDTGTRRVVTIDSRSHEPRKVDARSSAGTITWEQGSPCITVDAQSTGTRGDVSVASTLVGLEKCGGLCPSAGEVTVHGEEGVFTARFDGSGELTVIAPNGGDKSFALQCRWQ